MPKLRDWMKNWLSVIFHEGLCALNMEAIYLEVERLHTGNIMRVIA
jgi:hypothetical protein